MIAEIPSNEDFIESGLALFGLSWDMVSGLLATLGAAEMYDAPDVDMAAAFWAASRQTLLTSTVMAQQAVEGHVPSSGV